ncbi:MAG: PilZ domain-containing protein [Pyrinomonadaceae bacterium]
MTTKSNLEEKRFALRLSLRLPVVVSGRTTDGETWSEPTETDNISTSGALFQLNQDVKSGEKLYVRSHRPDGMPVEVMAEVARVAATNYGPIRVGVAVRESNDGWIRFFVSWVADDQPTKFEDGVDGKGHENSPLEESEQNSTVHAV